MIVVLPERWRVQLFLAPEQRSLALRAVDALDAELLDWERPLLASSSRVIVAALDLSVAELLIKLPEGAEAVGIDAVLTSSAPPRSGVRKMLLNARAHARAWLPPGTESRGVPVDLARWLDPAIAWARARGWT